MEKKRSVLALDDDDDDVESAAKKLKAAGHSGTAGVGDSGLTKTETTLTIDGLMHKVDSDKLSVRPGDGICLRRALDAPP